MWPSATSGCSLQNDSKMMPPPAMLPRRSSIQMIVPENMSSSAKSDGSSVDVIPTTTSNQLSSGGGSASRTFSSAATPPSFTAMSEVVPAIMTEYAHTFHPTLADVESSLKTEPTVPKVEPLSDSNTLSCTSDSYSVQQSGDAQQSPQARLVPSIKTTSTLCVSQPTDLYASSDNFMYGSASTMYSEVVTKTEQSENRSPVEELAPFDVTDAPPSIITADSNRDLMMSNLKAADSVGFINSNMRPASMLHSIRSSNLSDASFGKAGSFEYNELISQQRRQLATCFMKPSSSYEDIPSACYKSLPSTTESGVTAYPNFMNLQTESALNGSDANNIVFKKSPESEPVSASSLSMTAEQPMILENATMSLIPEVMGQRKNSLDDYSAVLPASKSQMGTSEGAFMGTQSQNSTMSEFVPSTLVDNAVNTVPKLEELVNSTAESYIRSAAGQSASSLSLVTNANCVANTLSLGTFLSEAAPCSQLLNSVICNTVTSTTNSCVSESSLPPSAYQCGSMVTDLEMSSATPKSMDGLELKDGKGEKSIDVPPEMKKTVEGMFSSEISRMTENDLLSYINTSCFDEVHVGQCG